MKKSTKLWIYVPYGLFWTGLWIWLIFLQGCTPEPMTECNKIGDDIIGDQRHLVIECETTYK